MINKNVIKLMRWFITLFLPMLMITGCENYPTEQGQQYNSGQLSDQFNWAQPHYLGMPINVDDYLAQVEFIQTVSPSLYQKNKDIYLAINDWIKKELPIEELNKVGLSSYQLKGKDNWGNVHLTGYYTPVIKARRSPEQKYRYPLYTKPENWQGPYPTREEIYNGAFTNQQLEVAYTDSLIDNFIMEVQGSGYIDFEDGSPLVFFGYNGKNGHPYSSIGRLLIEQGEIDRDKISMQAIKVWADKQNEQTVKNLLIQNKSAVFFKPQHNAPVVGSTGVPLLAKASVASDQSIIPAGSVLLVDVPLLDDKGIYNGVRELRLMIALDIGEAIKGQHLDIYQGIGDDAGHQAGFYNHYGQVWFINPPPNSHLALPIE